MDVEMVKNSSGAPGFSSGGYQTSQPNSDSWGQPPSSFYVFKIEGAVAYGHLIKFPPMDRRSLYSSDDEVDLRAELLAWDKASDEVLERFDRG